MDVHLVVAPLRVREPEPSLPGKWLDHHPLLDLDLRRAQHRLRPDLDERVRLLLVGGVDAARPVEVDAAEPAEHPGADERGSNGVALARLELGAGKAEPHGRNSLVEVSRVAVNQRRQPCECTQRSASGPFGFARTNRNCAHSASVSAAGLPDRRLPPRRRRRTRPRRARRTRDSGSAASNGPRRRRRARRSARPSRTAPARRERSARAGGRVRSSRRASSPRRASP